MRKLFLCTLMAAALSGGVANADPVIPVVPLDHAKAGVPAHPSTIKHSVERSEARVKKVDSNIYMKPGTNEIVQVAVNHLNRIVTPFDDFTVTTSSDVTQKSRDNVLYIGTSSEAPVTVFITEKGSEDVALSLTLIPRKIPPREIFLHLEKGHQNFARVSKKAEKWEKATPYLETIESLFNTLANQDLPPGYQFVSDDNGRIPSCSQAGLKFDFSAGQIVSGHNFIVHIGTATNVGTESIEFIEARCGNWDVAASAAYPLHVLNPGEITEVYVAMKRVTKQEIRIERPSLLLGSK